MFALSLVRKAPRLKKRQKKDDSSFNSPSSDSTLPATDADTNKKRKLHLAEPKVVTPPCSVAPSISSTSTTSTESFAPRRSRRLATKTPQGDGDTWIECRVMNIKDKKNKKNKSRSLFYSIETQRGWWDEPPSGASNVIYLGQGRGLEVVKSSKKRKSTGR
ncbi:hypothetical protein ACHAXN_007932 [Cyclotella atomus]|jgi:hypothetical protein